MDAPTRSLQHAVAAWVEPFARSALGPQAGAKLVDGTWCRSASAALLELGPTGPLLAPYVRLARTLELAGDQATTGLAIAAGSVRRILEETPRTIQNAPPALAQARRQALGVLAGLATQDAAGEALSSVAGPEAAAAVLQAMERQQIADPGHAFDLDLIEVVVDRGRGAREPVRWVDAVRIPVKDGPERRTGPVVLLEAAPRLQRLQGATWRLTGAAAHQTALDAESAVTRPWLDALRDAMLVACASSLGSLGDTLRSHGVLVWEDAPKDALRRIASATGAVAGPEPDHCVPGEGALRPAARGPAEPRAWWLEGAGPAYTLCVQASAVAEGAARTDMERLLRAVGTWSHDQRAVPGAGRWQEEVAASLRQAAPLVSGHGPIVWERLAEAVAAAVPETGAGSGSVLDLHAAVRQSVDLALGTAIQVLRLDEIHARRASDPLSLRGPGAPSHSRVRAGDVPPLM